MLIAQISDIHLGFEANNPGEFNRQRLDSIVRKLAAMSPTPDILLCTGDLTDKGDAFSYGQLQEALAGAPCPVHLCVGNHDDRDNFCRHFPETGGADGFVQYAVDMGPLVILVIDTLDPGEHGGAFCAQRAAWLREQLDGHADRPVIIALHHPPVVHGIEWMDADPAADWIARLAEVLKGRSNIAALLAGHVHRSFTATFAGHPLIVTGSSAPQVALELSPIDPETPDGRPMIVAEEPGYSVHHWTGNHLVSFFEKAGDHPVLARYDAGLQPLVQSLVPVR